jgi:hypothetical protein
MKKDRTLVLATIEQRIKELEKHGQGKVVIFIKKHSIDTWTTVREERSTES